MNAGPPGVGHGGVNQIRNARRDEHRPHTGDQGGGGAIIAARSAGKITVTGARGRAALTLVRGSFPRAPLASFRPSSAPWRNAQSAIMTTCRSDPCSDGREGKRQAGGKLARRPFEPPLAIIADCARSRSSRGDRSARDAGRGRANWTSRRGTWTRHWPTGPVQCRRPRARLARRRQRRAWHHGCRGGRRACRGLWARAFSGHFANEPANEPLEVFRRNAAPWLLGESVRLVRAVSPCWDGIGAGALAAGQSSSRRRREDGRNGARSVVEDGRASASAGG